MREMVDKVKRGEPLYGVSSLSPYMQGVAARNSRYNVLFSYVIPWPNLVNHNLVRRWIHYTVSCETSLTSPSTVSTLPNTTGKLSWNWKPRETRLKSNNDILVPCIPSLPSSRVFHSVSESPTIKACKTACTYKLACNLNGAILCSADVTQTVSIAAHIKTLRSREGGP